MSYFVPQMFRVIGNENSNKFWCWNQPTGSAIDENVSMEIRRQYIHNKYKNKLYCDIDPLSSDKNSLNEVRLL